MQGKTFWTSLQKTGRPKRNVIVKFMLTIEMIGSEVLVGFVVCDQRTNMAPGFFGKSGDKIKIHSSGPHCT